MAQAFNSNLKHVALAYKRLLNINVTDSTLLIDIEENPFFPTLLSISDTLDRYNVNNSAYNFTLEEFSDLNAPFVTIIDIPEVGRDFVLVTKITDSVVSYIYGRNKAEKMDRLKFIQRFKNVVLFAEPDQNSGEKNFLDQLKIEKTEKIKNKSWFAAIITLFVLIFVINLTSANALAYTIISILKLAGVTIAALLLAYDLDQNNTFVKNLCGTGTTTGCDAVLNSEAAKFFGIGWSEIGFFYFTFTSLLLFTPGFSFIYKAGWLSLFNAIAAPYIIFSIYYQLFIIKQWCPLCLTVQAILSAELIWNILYFWIPVHSFLFLVPGSIMPLLQIIFLALLPIVIWYSLKPYLVKAKDYNTYKSAFKRLQNNPEIFRSLLMQQPKAADNWQSLGIDLGNPNASNTIIEVCSTSCNPCGEAFSKMEKLIKDHKNIKLKVIFTGSKDDYSAPIVRHLLAVATQNSILKTEQAIHDWYFTFKQDYATFAAKYPVNEELTPQNAKIDAMSLWCSKSEIIHTPTIFVNGYRIPENYNIDELIFIL